MRHPEIEIGFFVIECNLVAGWNGKEHFLLDFYVKFKFSVFLPPHFLDRSERLHKLKRKRKFTSFCQFKLTTFTFSAYEEKLILTQNIGEKFLMENVP